MYAYGWIFMKRDARGKFVSNWKSETKQRVSVSLTNTAWRSLDKEAHRRGISRSEVIENFARTLECEQLFPAQETERKVATILESITDAFVAFDRDWRYTYVNRAAAKILHKTPQELLGKHVWNDVFPELVGAIPYRELHRAVTEQVPVSWEEFGESVESWIEANAYPSAEGVAVYFRDVTERKRLESELRQREQQFKMVAENAPDIITRFDAEFRHIYVSPSVELVTGIPSGEFVGKTNVELGMPEDLNRLWHDSLRQVFATGQEQTIEFKFPTLNSIRWYQARIVPEFASDDSVVSVLSIARDVTDYKQVEQALRESEERLQLALTAAQIFVWDMDLQTNEVVCSGNALEVWGLQEGTGEDFFALIHPDDRQRVIQATQRASAGEQSYMQEYRVICPDGVVRWLNSQGQVYLDETGRGVRMIGVSVDKLIRS
ncbi:PAS domain-containing protein [Microcoleus sp. K5-D4]|uniref:PAS domain-containing protein n=1 Tax=Microcoleus sp. K5-D4 TaxID=2818801 RepID=UPI002FD2D0D6